VVIFGGVKILKNSIKMLMKVIREIEFKLMNKLRDIGEVFREVNLNIFGDIK
jgi:hypothetical protein